MFPYESQASCCDPQGSYTVLLYHQVCTSTGTRSGGLENSFGFKNNLRFDTNKRETWLDLLGSDGPFTQGKMAPKANHSSTPTQERIGNDSLALSVLVAERNVTYGVNYSAPSINNFDVLFSSKTDGVKVSTLSSTPTEFDSRSRKSSHNKNMRKNESNLHENNDDKKIFQATDGVPQSIRKSQRQPKPHRQLSWFSQFDEKSRVRYDVNLVPLVQKNRDFVKFWRQRDTLSAIAAKRACYSRECKISENISEHNELKHGTCDLNPFIGDDTVLWIPSTRTQWEDCVSEMTTVCKSAAFRRYSSVTNVPFYAPLSRDYIRDRVDIDDPLIGYQLRHRAGGWMQGFILYTNFTHWSHYFKWDSVHEASGVHAARNASFKVDIDGSLAAELENQERSGDPLAGGVVFPSIAEIGLVGGLGCGEYLLRMALDDIRSSGKYHYVVLQATDASRTFYEKFGFVRVGAISRYGPRVKGKRFLDTQAVLSDVVGYRHWTYAHESEASLGKHGGPSYMMARRIEQDSSELDNKAKGLFLQTMRRYAVLEKPKVKQAGAAYTPLTKKCLRTCSSIQNIDDALRIPCLHNSLSGEKKRQKSSVSLQSSPLPCAELSYDSPSTPNPTTKRRRVTSKSSYQFMEQRNQLLSPPPPGASLTYQQKQYQSVWLAVPPKTEVTLRRAPRERSLLGSLEKSRSTSKSRKSANESVQSPIGTVRDVVTQVDPKHEDVTSNHLPLRGESAHFVVETASSDISTKKQEDNKENSPDLSVKKQKVPPIPKRLAKEQHFFNRVVKLKGSRTCNYFYVLHFDVKKMVLEVIPMTQDGVLDGKRSGRPMWKAQVQKRSSLLDADKFEIVRTQVVTKSPFVANERWDIL